MNKEILMIIIVILIAIDILKEGYLNGFVGAFLNNIVRYKKTTLTGIIITVFSIVYLDLPVAKKFSNKYYEKTLQGIENKVRTATPEEIIILQQKANIEKIDKEKYSKNERFFANQGDGDTTAGTIVIFLFLRTIFKK